MSKEMIGPSGEQGEGMKFSAEYLEGLMRPIQQSEMLRGISGVPFEGCRCSRCVPPNPMQAKFTDNVSSGNNSMKPECVNCPEVFQLRRDCSQRNQELENMTVAFGTETRRIGKLLIERDDTIARLRALLVRFIEVYGNVQHMTMQPCSCRYCQLNKDIAAEVPEAKFCKERVP